MFRVRVEGSLQGEAYLITNREEVIALGLRDAGASEEAQASAFRRTVEAIAPRLRELIASRYAAHTVTVEHMNTPALPYESTMELHAKTEDGRMRATLYLCLAPQLVASLQSSPGVLFPEASPEQIKPANLSLVMDVELNATLRFGQRQLSLREVMDLTSGSVIELDRQVDEPVELILDGRVVARGEAVIIDGNYGMRVTEVLQGLDTFVPTR
jgi:flagellar motor switch protein FliN